MHHLFYDVLACFSRPVTCKRNLSNDKRFFLPLSVVISQKTLSGFPDASGSIQNSPSPTESSLCRISLHERPGAQFVEPFFTEINFPTRI